MDQICTKVKDGDDVSTYRRLIAHRPGIHRAEGGGVSTLLYRAGSPRPINELEMSMVSEHR